MGLAVVGVLMICAAVYLGCRMFDVPATLPVLLVVSVLLAAGAVNASALPGMSQLDDMKTELDQWTDERAAAASGDDGELAGADSTAAEDCPASAQ